MIIISIYATITILRHNLKQWSVDCASVGITIFLFLCLPFLRLRLRVLWRLTLLLPYVLREMVRPSDAICCPPPKLRCKRELTGTRPRGFIGYRMRCEATAPPDAAATAARFKRACTPFPLLRFGTLPAHDPTTTPPTFNWYPPIKCCKRKQNSWLNIQCFHLFIVKS